MCFFFSFMIHSRIIILVYAKDSIQWRDLHLKKREDFVNYEYSIMIYITISIIKLMKQGNMFGKECDGIYFHIKLL